MPNHVILSGSWRKGSPSISKFCPYIEVSRGNVPAKVSSLETACSSIKIATKIEASIFIAIFIDLSIFVAIFIDG